MEGFPRSAADPLERGMTAWDYYEKELRNVATNTPRGKMYQDGLSVVFHPAENKWNELLMSLGDLPVLLSQ